MIFRGLPWMGSKGRPWAIALASLAFLAIVVTSLNTWLDRPLRAWAEKTMNANLDGYTVKLGRWDTHLWQLAMELDNLSIIQNAHPETPVAHLEAMRFTISWRALLHLHLLGNLTIDRPVLRLDLGQLQEEAKSETSLKDKGWQAAVKAIYPLNLEKISIHDGSVQYLSASPDAQAIRMTNVEFTAKDIRNVSSDSGSYPSPMHLEASLFETGKIWFDGAADFLAEPAASLKGEIRIIRVPLDRLGPDAAAVQLRMKGGFLSASGSFESMPDSTSVLLREVLLEQLKADYVTSDATADKEKKRVEAVANAAKQADNAPGYLMRIDRLRIVHSEFGFVDHSSEPEFRLFLSDLGLEMLNVSNQSTEGRAGFKAYGSFMGSGRTKLTGGFHPGMDAPRFDVHLEMQDANLTSMNNLLKSYAGFDVTAGQFSLFTELDVKDHRVTGYVKPMIRNLSVYGKAQDKNKSFGNRTWQHLVDGMAFLLQNNDSKKLATKVRISGATDDPNVSNYNAIMALISNGFMKAIQPGFQKSSPSSVPASAEKPKP